MVNAFAIGQSVVAGKSGVNKEKERCDIHKMRPALVVLSLSSLFLVFSFILYREFKPKLLASHLPMTALNRGAPFFWSPSTCCSRLPLSLFSLGNAKTAPVPTPISISTSNPHSLLLTVSAARCGGQARYQRSENPASCSRAARISLPRACAYDVYQKKKKKKRESLRRPLPPLAVTRLTRHRAPGWPILDHPLCSFGLAKKILYSLKCRSVFSGLCLPCVD